jgi:AraC-like DNA-binding protein
MTVDLFGDTLAALRTGSAVTTRTDACAPWSMRLPAFAGAGVHVVTEGSCVLIQPDDPPLTLVSGDLVFLRRGGQHILCSDSTLTPADYAHDRVAQGAAFGQLRIDGPGSRTVLACTAYKLDASSSHPLLASLPDVIYLPAGAPRGGALEGSIRQVSDEMADPYATSPSIVVALIEVLLLRILRAWHIGLPAEHATGWAAAVADPAIGPALQAIHASPAEPWTVDTLAREAGLSRAAFARRFSTVLGMPPLAYLTGWRMTTARRLLRETQLPLAAVAERTGYGSEFAFAKAFKRESGIAPGSYRLAAVALWPVGLAWPILLLCRLPSRSGSPSSDGASGARTS